MDNLSNLTTEKRNSRTLNLDTLSIKEICELMNQEDQKVPLIIKQKIPEISKVIEQVIKTFNKNGRLIYMGAGTSGRMGVIDAVECVPTFGVDFNKVIGLMCGGNQAMIKAAEGAEDSEKLAQDDLKKIKLTHNDIVVGIAASGRTPYVIGGLKYANIIGATSVALACNINSEIGKYADLKIEVDCGPEILAGSTRLKAGSAQKMILNMISTGSMIGIGKVYSNLMVDLKATNQKLVERSKRIISEATGVNYEIAESYLKKAHDNVKVAIVMILTGCSQEEAFDKLKKAKGFVNKAL